MEALIRAAINREIAEERRRAEAERKRLAEAEAKRTGKTVAEVEKATPKKTDSEILRSTPEAARLSADFKSNRGRLPWPVSQGNIVQLWFIYRRWNHQFGTRYRYPHGGWRRR